MTKVKKGDIVAIKFWDHTINDDSEEPLLSVVYGRIHKTHKDYYVIDHWHPFSDECERTPEKTVEVSVIVRTTIVQTLILVAL